MQYLQDPLFEFHLSVSLVESGRLRRIKRQNEENQCGRYSKQEAADSWAEAVANFPDLSMDFYEDDEDDDYDEVRKEFFGLS